MTFPADKERVAAMQLYINNYMLDAKLNDAQFIESVNQVLTEAKIAQVSQKFDGFHMAI